MANLTVGCTVWSFNKFESPYAPPYEDAIESIGTLGIDAIELILYEEADLDTYWTPSRIKKIRDRLDFHGLALSEFALYHDAIPGLVSLNPDKRERALEVFERGVSLARELGSPLINMVAHWPEGLSAPATYPPTYIYHSGQGVIGFNPEVRYTLPHPFDWEATWATYVQTLRSCTDIAKQYGLKLALEGHPNVVVSYVDSFLRLFDAIEDKALGMNYDTGMQMIMREYVPWSIYKLGDRLLHMHVRDTDGLLSYNLPVGRGILPWDQIIRALYDVDYEGVLSLELGGYRDANAYVLSSVERLREFISEYVD